MITAEIQSVDIDNNGNIRVTTEYKKDGTWVQTGNTRYSFGALATQAEIETKIQEDVQQHCDNLVARNYVKNKNMADYSKIATNVVGLTKQATETDITIGDTIYTVDETSVKSTTPKVV